MPISFAGFTALVTAFTTYPVLAICCQGNPVITMGKSIAFDLLMTVLSSLTLYRLHFHFLPKIHL